MIAKLLLWNLDIESEIEPANGTDFQLSELYGYLEAEIIQTLYLTNDIVMLIDEESKLNPKKVKQHNEKATRLLHRAGGFPGDFILGNAILCPRNMLQ